MNSDKKVLPAASVLAKAMSAAGLPIKFEVAQAIIQANKSRTSRVLKQLVDTGSVVKARLIGTTEHVWGGTPDFTKAIARSVNGTWVPPPEFEHDQLALQVMYSLAEKPDNVIPERMLANFWPKGARPPDGLVGLPSLKLAAVEVERSKKTGRVNGFERLAHSIVARMYSTDDSAPVLEQFLEDKDDPLKVVETLLVAPRGYALSIARRVTRILDGYGDMEARYWYYVELGANGKLPLAVCKWYAGEETPAMPAFLLWSPKDRR